MSTTAPLELSVSPPVSRTLAWDALVVLAQAPAADVLDRILCDTFRARSEGISLAKFKSWVEKLQATQDQVVAAGAALTALIRLALFQNVSARDQLVALFPASFHANLRTLLCKLIWAHYAEWKEQITSELVSPPKLVDFDWRVDTKVSSNHLTHMQMPTVLVEMQLQQAPSSLHLVPSIDRVQFELSPQALQTMLSGLEKIREQLSGIQ